MKLKEKIKLVNHFSWLLPFISFFIGYWIAELFFGAQTITVPKLVGTSITQGIRQLSAQKLNIRIIAEKEDLDLPEGTIISQKPSPSQPIKAQQAIFVVISKKPQLKKTPYLLNKTADHAKNELIKQGIKYKEFNIDSNAPQNMIIAQYPAPKEPINGPVYIYKAVSPEQKFIFPSLKDRPFEEIQSFLARYNIKSTITYKNQSSHENYKVTEQRPLQGTLISLKHPPHVQLHLKAE